MASVINTNVASLNAQRNLTMSQTDLATSLQRLSSGLRINSAKDDAAGLAISDRFTTQIRGLNQAVRNANDAISLSQTAEGALGEMTSNLQRIRELAVQSANATNSASDRRALDLEVQERLAELDRIASQTSFNGQKILDGTFGNAAFQVGANVGETITIDLDRSMKPGSIGAIATATSADLSTIFTTATDAVAGSYTSGDLSSLNFSLGSNAVPEVYTASNGYAGVTSFGFDFTTDQVSFDVSLDGGTTTDTVTLDSNTNNEVGLLAAINGQLGTNAAVTASVSGGALVFTANTGATANDIVVDNFDGDVDGSGNTVGDFIAGSVTTAGADAVPTTTVEFDVDGDTVTLNGNYANIGEVVTAIEGELANASEYTVEAVDANTFRITSNTAGTASAFDGVVDNFQTTAITGASGGTVVAAEDAATAGELVVGASDISITIGTNDAVSVAAGTYTSAQDLVDAVNTALAGEATAELNDDGTMSIISQKDVSFSGAGATTLGLTDTVKSGSLTDANVKTVDDANNIIRRLDSALNSVSVLRSNFGAIQNRFESTIANLSTAVENLSASRSRIQDADFASETANLTRAQILQQAGTAILAQANALPQSVLSLLG